MPILRALCLSLPAILLPALLMPAVVLTTEPAQAQSQSRNSGDLKLKRSFGRRGDGEGHVQIRSMLAPVKRKASSLRTAKLPVTPILTVISKDKVGYVCDLGPRVTDALLRAWFEKPIVLGDIFDPGKSGERVYKISKSQAQLKEDARLIRMVNQALKDKLVTEILVVKGVLRTGGGAISKLPFASVRGCVEREEETEEAPKEN